MIRLYLDEDVPEAIAMAVRLRGYEHSGIIISKQLPIGVIVKALLRLLSSVNYGKVRNNIIWLSDWIT
jgi:hypothetical protein